MQYGHPTKINNKRRKITYDVFKETFVKIGYPKIDKAYMIKSINNGIVLFVCDRRIFLCSYISTLSVTSKLLGIYNYNKQ